MISTNFPSIVKRRETISNHMSPRGNPTYVIGNDGVDCSIQSGGTIKYNDLAVKRRTGKPSVST